jgi:putative glutamine amidotransferase
MKDSRKKKSKSARRPLILISPETELKGEEFADVSISLSEAYLRAVVAAGGLPLVLPCVPFREVIAESVFRCDGVLLTGGNDVNPRLYARQLPPKLRKTVAAGPPERDLRELILIDEVFQQRKPVFAICRGHQMMNVALGGTLVVDIATQVPGALNHRRMDRKGEVVHEARLTAGSMLAKITGKLSLGVNSTHHQAVGRLAEPLQATAVSRDGVVEAMELHPGSRQALPYFLTVQFHPERLADRHAEHQALFNNFVQACIWNRKSKV